MPFIITDVLASEYGWTKQYILDCLYFDEVQILFPIIHKRQIASYQMQLSIVQNPHVEDPQRLWDQLNKQDPEYIGVEELDKTGFEQFRKSIAKAGGLVVKY